MAQKNYKKLSVSQHRTCVNHVLTLQYNQLPNAASKKSTFGFNQNDFKNQFNPIVPNAPILFTLSLPQHRYFPAN